MNWLFQILKNLKYVKICNFNNDIQLLTKKERAIYI